MADEPPPSRPWRDGVALLARFVALFLALQWLYYLTPDAVLAGSIVHPLLAKPAAWLIDTVGIADAHAVANEIRGSSGVLYIIRGCDGSSSMFLWLAAVGAFTTSWRHKLRGVALGLLLLHALNLCRVTVLYAVLPVDLQLFDVVHEFLAPIVTVLATCLCYTLWCAAGARIATPSSAPTDAV